MSVRRWVAAVLLLVAWSAQAHRGNESRLALKVLAERVEGSWEVSLHDLPSVLQLAAPATDDRTAASLLSRLRLTADDAPCAITPLRHETTTRDANEAFVVHFEARCTAAPRQLAVDGRLLFAQDPQHLALLKLEAGALVRTAALSADSGRQLFTLSEPRWSERLADEVRSGVWHIWTGFDHLLFLLALLLPAVLLPAAAAGARPLRVVAIEVLKVVSAFTLAHSLTLTLAGLGLVTLPPRLTESVIALSVLLAALLNLRRGDAVARWPAAFAFGLVHGFGFAAALGELGASGGALALTLLGFNLGVELGQLAVVAVFVPLAFAMRQRGWYRSVVVRGGSVAIALLALAWFAERAFNVSLLPGS